MSAPENPNHDAQTLAEIRAAVESLRGVFQVAALSGIVLACTLFLFFYREVRQVRRQSEEFKVFVTDYNTNILPKIEMSRTNLEAFSKTNSAFAPLYKKYFTTNTATVAAPVP